MVDWETFFRLAGASFAAFVVFCAGLFVIVFMWLVLFCLSMLPIVGIPFSVLLKVITN